MHPRTVAAFYDELEKLGFATVAKMSLAKPKIKMKVPRVSKGGSMTSFQAPKGGSTSVATSVSGTGVKPPALPQMPNMPKPPSGIKP